MLFYMVVLVWITREAYSKLWSWSTQIRLQISLIWLIGLVLLSDMSQSESIALWHLPSFTIYSSNHLRILILYIHSLIITSSIHSSDFIDDVPVIEILWWRFFLSTVICILYNQFTAQPCLALTAWRDRQLLLSALFGTITATCTVFALR